MTTERTDTRMEPDRDVLQVELIPGLPWVVGVPVPSASSGTEGTEVGGGGDPSASSGTEGTEVGGGGDPSAGSGTEGEETADRQAAREARVDWYGLGISFLLVVGSVVLFLLPVFDEAWQQAALAAPLLVVALATLHKTRPRMPVDWARFWTWGRQRAPVGQCAPSRVTWTHGGEQ